MNNIDVTQFIEVAISAVCNAGKEIAYLFALSPNEIALDWKSDETPVTKADYLSEKLISETLLSQFPHLSLLREEAGVKGNSDDSIVCLVDPLDGTSSFSRGIPTYSILVALAEHTNSKTNVIACVVHEPQTGRIWYATKGEGAFLIYYNESKNEYSRPRKIHVSSPSIFPAEKAMIIYDAALKFRDVVPSVNAKLVALNACYPRFRRARMIGSLALQFAYVASGFAEATVADAIGGPYDLCGHLLVDEAGGQTSDLEICPIDIFKTKIAIATNGDRHNELAKILLQAYRSSNF